MGNAFPESFRVKVKVEFVMLESPFPPEISGACGIGGYVLPDGRTATSHPGLICAWERFFGIV
ncbi:MAG: hypothetical protein RR337_11280 [Clostridia bacterium]